MKKNKGMKCTCGAIAKYKKGLVFNGYKIDGWVCSKCKEVYYHPEQVQRILLLNKLKHKIVITKLGQVRSNLIWRIPKDMQSALGLEKGEEIAAQLEDNAIKLKPVNSG